MTNNDRVASLLSVVIPACSILLGESSVVRADCTNSVYGWTATFSGAETSVDPIGVAFAPDGSVVVVGSFNRPADFDPGDAVDVHMPVTPDSPDVFISKFAADGSYLWTRTLGDERVLGLSAHSFGNPNFDVASDGSIIFAGGLATQDGNQVPFIPFIVRLNADGWVIWRFVCPTLGGYFTTITVVGDNVVLSGTPNREWHSGCSDFDATEGVDLHCAGGGRSSFLSKYRLDGSYEWTRFTPISWPSGSGQMNDVTVDDAGNVLVVGIFNGTVDFDPGEGQDVRQSQWNEAFLTKLYANGTYGWTLTWDNASRYWPYLVRASAGGVLYISGDFSGPVDFDPSEAEDTRVAQEAPGCNGQCTDVVVSRFNADGSYGWTRTFGGPGREAPRDFALDPAGNPIILGLFGATGHNPRNYTADFDPSAAVDLRTTEGFSDIFVTKLYSYGDYAWTQTYSDRAEGPQLPHGNEDTAYVNGVAAGPLDAIAIVGAFGNAYFGNVRMDFDPTEGMDVRSTPRTDGFVTTLVADPLVPTILACDPAGGTIDVRQDRSISGRIPQGIERARVTFSCRVRDGRTQNALSDQSFKMIGLDGWQGGILEVTPVEDIPNTYDVLFAESIRAGKWTELIPIVETLDGIRIADNDSASRILLGFLPGDVDGSRTTGPLDILTLVNSLTGAMPLPLERMDINRSDVATPADVRRLIQLLDGVNTSRPWLGASLNAAS